MRQKTASYKGCFVVILSALYSVFHATWSNSFFPVDKRIQNRSRNQRVNVEKRWDVWRFQDDWSWHFPSCEGLTGIGLSLESPDQPVCQSLVPLRTEDTLAHVHNLMDGSFKLWTQHFSALGISKKYRKVKKEVFPLVCEGPAAPPHPVKSFILGCLCPIYTYSSQALWYMGRKRFILWSP